MRGPTAGGRGVAGIASPRANGYLESSARVLIANELCFYREVITGGLRERRPHLEVLCVEPGDLDREVSRIEPDLVICSRLTETVRDHARAWVVLYPEGESWVEAYALAHEVSELSLEQR